MFIKIIGMSFIIMTTGLAGIKISQMLAERVKRLELIILMIDRISVLIDFRALHTGEILTDLANDTCFEKLDFIKNAYEFYRGGEAFHEAWEKALKNDVFLGSEERDQLFLLGSSLGTSSAEGQLSMLKIHSSNIRHICDTVSPEINDKRKLYRTLGVLSGIFISVMLI